MWTWLPKAFDYLVRPANLVAVALASGAVVLLPRSWIAAIHLENLHTEWGWVVGLVFLLSTVFALVNVGRWGGARWQERRAEAEQLAGLMRVLGSLDPSEKAVLREFFIQSRNTIRAPIDDPIVAGLSSKQIIRQVGGLGEPLGCGMVFPVALTDFAKPMVSPELVGLPNALTDVTEEQMHTLEAARPHFVQKISNHERRQREDRW